MATFINTSPALVKPTKTDPLPYVLVRVDKQGKESLIARFAGAGEAHIAGKALASIYHEGCHVVLMSFKRWTILLRAEELASAGQ